MYWPPPEAALKAAQEHVLNPVCSKYGNDDGLIELREALVEKVRSRIKMKRLMTVIRKRNLSFV